METCKTNGVDPQRYFTDLLTRLVDGWPNSQIDKLMPWRWAPATKSQPERQPDSGNGRRATLTVQGFRG